MKWACRHPTGFAVRKSVVHFATSFIGGVRAGECMIELIVG